MTVSTITMQQNVLRELGLNPDDTTMQGRALRWLNKALDKTQGFMPDMEFLKTAEMEITLVDGQAAYVMPSDFFAMTQLRIDEEDLVLEEVTREEFDRLYPDPANDEEDVPSVYSFEYDRTSNRHVIRFAPIPDTHYECHGIIKRWHPELNASQNIQSDKFQTVLEEGATWEGSKSVYADPEYTQYRAELKQSWLEASQAFQQIMAMSKPRSKQIKMVLRKSDY